MTKYEMKTEHLDISHNTTFLLPRAKYDLKFMVHECLLERENTCLAHGVQEK